MRKRTPPPRRRRPSQRATPARSRPAGRGAAHARLLAVDIGNSEITIGRFEADVLARTWRLTSARATPDEIAVAVERMLATAEDGGGRATTGAVIGSVVPALTPAWIDALARAVGDAPVEVGVETARFLSLGYRDPRTVGPDRIANAVAVRALYGTPAIVVDLGTATTFDCVARDGTFLGGAITLGIGASLEALAQRSARLPRIELREPAHALGRSTEESLRTGLVWGHAGQVDALVRRLALEMKGTPHVIATGGYASLVAPECETINRVDSSLTLKGLKIVWEENR